MIDSGFPGVEKSRLNDVVPHAPFVTERCKPEITFLICAMLKSSAKLLDSWVPPAWTYSNPHGQERNASTNSVSRFRVTTPSSRSGSSYFSSRDSSTTNLPPDSEAELCWTPEGSLILGVYGTEAAPPPTILLRCREYVPISTLTNPRALARVDLARDSALLGWEGYNDHLVQAVLEVPGHHFNLFSEQHVSSSS